MCVGKEGALLSNAASYCTFSHLINIFQMESVREGKKTKDRGAFPSSPGCLFMGQESFSHIELRNTRGIMGQLFNCCVTVTPYINFCIKEL